MYKNYKCLVEYVRPNSNNWKKFKSLEKYLLKTCTPCVCSLYNQNSKLRKFIMHLKGKV